VARQPACYAITSLTTWPPRRRGTASRSRSWRATSRTTSAPPAAADRIRPDGVVGLLPTLDEHLGLEQGVERLPLQELVSELSVEALHVAVLPRRPRLDVQRLHADPSKPLPYARGGELASIVAADVLRHAPTHEQITQPLQHVLARELLGHVDRQALPRVLIHDRQHPDRTPVRRSVHHEVVAPHMVPMRRPQPDARPVVQPEPPSL
jgi:hypothetical protein